MDKIGITEKITLFDNPHDSTTCTHDHHIVKPLSTQYIGY